MKKVMIGLVLFSVILLLSGCNSIPEEFQFSKHPSPVWGGQWVAGDPSIIRMNDSYYLYYTGVTLGDLSNDDDDQIIIGIAHSTDGINWDFAKPLINESSEESIALAGNMTGWDRILETAFVLQKDDEFLMYYAGYDQSIEETGNLVAEAQIGVASSSDGLTFDRFLSNPVIETDTVNDKDAVFSPTVILDNGTYYMIYTGWCLENCTGIVQGFGLLGAISSDGMQWSKHDELIIDETDIPWGINVKEAELVKGPDGLFYLFFTSDLNRRMSAIGMARSDHPFGPWDIHPYPIISKTYSWEGTGPIAPAVLIEEGVIRVWYMAPVDATFSDFHIGYAESELSYFWSERK